MGDDYEIGFGKPPKSSQWKKGQSGNPKGHPKTRADHLKDAAAILSEPVTARTPEGRTVSLDGYEAAYLALCKKGLKGNAMALIAAIRLMLEVQPALETREADSRQAHEKVLAAFDPGAAAGCCPAATGVIPIRWLHPSGLPTTLTRASRAATEALAPPVSVSSALCNQHTPP